MRTFSQKFPRFDDEYDYACDYKQKSKRRPRYVRQEIFKCRHCRRFIGQLPSGGHQRNHCPYCLYSRHVDGWTTGDRLSSCGASMKPLGSFQRAGGEYVIIHRCLDCGFERFNRIAADDDFDLVLSLPVLPSRDRREEKARRWELESIEAFNVDITPV